ncbi:MAG TPA: hypothetical protein VGQ77_08450, partial [Methylomirabilota bacterium]|nr:hypothetical protein [Methylomirabilota bacterium]
MKRTLAHLSRAALAAAFVTASALPASAQVFLAATPHPEFTIGPLIVQAMVPKDLGTVQVNISWSLSFSTGRTPPHAQDLFLLWPREVAAATAPGAADPELARYVESRGLQTVT